MFLAVIAGGMVIAWILGPETAAIAEVDAPAPDFTVELIEGGNFTLSDVEGTVVLNFWASWCIPCRTEIPDISAFADSHPDVTVIGVAVEDVEQNARDFADEIEASYPLALGTDEIEAVYPRLGLPVTYIIDDGVVTDVFNGIVDEEVLRGLIPAG